MNMRPMLLGLAATAVSLPALAAALPPAPANLAQLQVSQSAAYSVRNTQDLLNRLGYDAGPVDGVMGSRTQSAIMAYQRDNGLAVTGNASAALYDHVLTTHAQAGTATATQPVATTAQASQQTVVDVQTHLLRRGYDIPAVSGQVDAATRAAVVAYQQDAGLTPTGEVDQSLLASLVASNLTRADYTSQRERVRDIQIALNNLGYNAGTPDGALGLTTQAAIRSYEAANGLPVTGAATPELLARLAPDAGVGSGPADRQTVGAIQEELIARGYLDGEADGRPGAATSAAIREFQTDAGLPVTGTASTAFLSSLRASGLTRSEAGQQRRVSRIEEELQVKGYAVGPVDGVLDAQSAAAIRAFQQDAGLPVDGRASSDLLRAIRASEVVAGPQTAEEAVQSLIQGTTTRLLENIVTPRTE